MYIKKDYSYINSTETRLIENGYGEMTVHSIHFDRYFTEEEMKSNRLLAESMTREEWNKSCEEFAESLLKPLTEILERFISKYNIHQVSELTSTTAHFKSDWDLHFWSDRGWNGCDYMTRFELSFNGNRTPKQNMELLEEIISLVETMEYENIGCRIQYDAFINEEKVEENVETVYKNLAGKFVEFHGMTGKIKLVREENGIKKYGFFKKNARSRYYPIWSKEIVAMAI